MNQVLIRPRNEKLQKKEDRAILNLLAPIVMFFYLTVMVLKYFDILPLLWANISIVAVGSVGILLSVLKNGFRAQDKILFFVFIYTLFGMMSLLYNGNADLQELLWPLGTMGIGVMLLNFTIPYRFMRVLYYVFCGVFISLYLVLGSITDIERTSSRNAVSILTLLVFSFLIISAYENRESVGMDVPLVFLFVCFLAVGRGGILLALIVLLLFLIFRLHKGESSFRKWYVLPLYAIGLALVYYLIMRFLPQLIEDVIENFESKQLQSLRSDIWNDYVNKTFSSLTDFLFGAPVSGTRILDMFSENLHNSFLALHSKYGIFMLLAVIGMMLSALLRFIQKKNFYYLIILLALLFRMNFEYCNFNACMDNVLIYLLFVYAAVGKNHPSLRKDYVSPTLTGRIAK